MNAGWMAVAARPVQRKPLVTRFPRQLESADMTALARGAAVIGGGGGGDPYIGRLLAERALREHGPVRLVHPEDLPDDAFVVCIAQMGSPTVGAERLPAYAGVGPAVHTLADHLGRMPTHISCLVSGGISTLTGVVAAAQLGLPLIDGDGAGRAFPELQIVLPGVIGVPATPMSITDEHGNSGVLTSPDARWADRLARSMTVAMGCTSVVTSYPMSGGLARDALIGGTLGLCLRIGRSVGQARSALADPVAAAAAEIGGRVLTRGKVVDVARRTASGAAQGEATVVGGGRQALIRFQNENLVAEIDGRVAATTPDLVIVLDTATGEPITTELLRFGHRVSVVSAPADPRWHSPAGIAVAGPRAFGYDVDPVRAAFGGGLA